MAPRQTLQSGPFLEEDPESVSEGQHSNDEEEDQNQESQDPAVKDAQKLVAKVRSSEIMRHNMVLLICHSTSILERLPGRHLRLTTRGESMKLPRELMSYSNPGRKRCRYPIYSTFSSNEFLCPSPHHPNIFANALDFQH